IVIWWLGGVTGILKCIRHSSLVRNCSYLVVSGFRYLDRSASSRFGGLHIKDSSGVSVSRMFGLVLKNMILAVVSLIDVHGLRVVFFVVVVIHLFKQLGPGVKTRFHGVHDEKRVWFEVELKGAQGDHEAKVFQVSNDDIVVAQRWLEDKQPEKKTNTDCLVKEYEKEYHTRWKINTGKVLDSCNQRSTQQCMKIRVTKHLGVSGLQQHNGLVDEINVTFFAKVRCFLIQSGLSKVFWAEDRTRYKEDSNEATFVVDAVEKIYAHESLTFNNIVACAVIFKWKAGLKDDMDTWSDVCKAEICATKGLLYKAKGNVLGMEIVRDQSEGSLSGDCNVEKNDKWSCIYTVRSQEYQMVYTRLNIASADVGVLDKFDCRLQTDVQVFVDFDYAMGKSITVMESTYELRLVADIGALVKGSSYPRFQHKSRLLRIGID
nr:zinc finger, CCHC-type [Tanacetum cinerariifolium]